MTFLAIIRLSWKNIWRQPLRSSVVVAAVVLATWSGIFLIGFYNGMTMQFVRDQLGNYTAHIQVHETRFADEKLPQYTIPDAQERLESLKEEPFVRAVSGRTVLQGLASSAANNFGVVILGVDSDDEQTVSGIHTYLQEGNYLEQPSRNPVLIGSALAKRLSAGLRSRLVLTFQDVEGNITAGAFRVAGIFHTPNTAYNEGTVLVRRTDINRLIGRDDAVHEIAVLVDDYALADSYVARLSGDDRLLIRSWAQLSPTLSYVGSAMDTMLYVIMLIIIIALCFGIINTMLMAVLERTRELGMLRAVGMNKRRTFLLIMSETVFLTMVGAPAGLLLSWLFISWTGSVGIDLGNFSQGLEMYGFRSIVYPELSPVYYINITLMMFAATLAAAVFPALKALRLNPIESIRKP